MSEYYVGITIGPIIETLQMASRPASLWCASAMFSWLTEDICNKAIAMGGKIISPYYPQESTKLPSEYSVTSAGVGKYHDRIIFKKSANDEHSLKSEVHQIIEYAKQDLAKQLISKDLVDGINNKSSEVSENIHEYSEEELKAVILNYLQLRYIIEEKKDETATNCILRLSPYLDSAELCPVFNVDQSIQPIMTLFEGKSDEKHNELVKRCFGLKYGDNSIVKQTKDEKGNTTYKVRDVESIVESVAGSDRKIFDYYAIVQADADSMSKLLENLNNDDSVETFSKICLDYTSKAAEMINNGFGGMTIYAGGDDLLFISPLENKKGTTVFELCAEINKEFQTLFKKTYENSIPTLSFGISINYKRFPLYEALNDALDMLETAKKVQNDDEKKNKTAVHIRKHSGQSIKFRYTNSKYEKSLENEIIGKDIASQLVNLINTKADQKALKSMLYKIGLYRPILKSALANEMDMEKVFENLFDSEYHDTVKDYISCVKAALVNIYNDVKKCDNKDFALEKLFDKEYSENDNERKGHSSDEEIAIDLLFSILRIAKFYSEKKGRK